MRINHTRPSNSIGHRSHIIDTLYGLIEGVRGREMSFLTDQPRRHGRRRRDWLINRDDQVIAVYACGKVWQRKRMKEEEQE